MTGFPHTPEGAIGQLAQIDLAVLQSMSLSTAEEVYNAWALPGGVRAEDWWITASVRAFLSSTGMGEVKDPSASVSLEPAAALVKGTDGPDWATVCVLMKVSATYKSEGQIAFAHCERMQWVGGRWMVAPGAPPAPAPATWPGTAAGTRGRLAHLVHRPHHRTRPPRRHGRGALTMSNRDQRLDGGVAQRPCCAWASWWRSPPSWPPPSGSERAAGPMTTAEPTRPPGDSSSQTGQQGQNVSVDQVAPETAPADGVVIPTGADQVDGYPTRFPQTDLGAVALQVEVAKAQVGFDYDQAAAVAGLYANPEDKAVFEQRARDAVALRRQQAGVPKEGDVPAPASYAVTPIAYTLEELDTGYYAVNLLSYVTLTTADGKVSDGLYAGTQLMRWLEVDGVGDWRLVQGSTADIEHLVSTGQPKAVAPGTPEYKQAGWIPINGAPQ